MVTGCTQVLKMVLLESGIYGELFKPNTLYHFLSCKPIYLTCSSSENFKKCPSLGDNPVQINFHSLVLLAFSPLGLL